MRHIYWAWVHPIVFAIVATVLTFCVFHYTQPWLDFLAFIPACLVFAAVIELGYRIMRRYYMGIR